MIKTSKQLIVLMLTVWALLMLLFTFLDLPFSKAVYKGTESAFAHFFEVWGELPAFLLFFASGHILLRAITLKRKLGKVLYGLTGIFFITAGGVGGVLISISRLSETIKPTAIVVTIVIISVISTGLQLLLRKVSDDKMEAYINVAWAGILIIFAEILLVNVLKVFWGRMRFRDLFDNYSLFTSWYNIRGIQENGVTSEMYKSFPSGHSANGWASVAILLYMPLKRNWRLATLSLAVIWGLCTSLSRVIYGAHFATDVLMGALISLVCIFMISKWFNISLLGETRLAQANQKNITTQA